MKKGIEKCLRNNELDLLQFVADLIEKGYRGAYYDTCELLLTIYRNDKSLQIPSFCEKIQEVFDTLQIKAACHKKDDAIQSAISNVTTTMFKKLEVDLKREVITYTKRASSEIRDLLTKKLTKDIDEKLRFKKEDSIPFVLTESEFSLFSKKDNKIKWGILRPKK